MAIALLNTVCVRMSQAVFTAPVAMLTSWGFVKECTADELCLCPEGACTAGFDEFLVCFLRHAELPRHPSDGALRFEPLVHQGEQSDGRPCI